jgi:predicted permease
MLAAFNMVSPGYFETMGIPLLEGRHFRSSDANGQGVVIVNQTFAQRYFGWRGAIGHRLRLFESGRMARPEIVGVVRDTRYETLRDSPPREVYLDLDQHDDPIASTVYIKTRSDPLAMFNALQVAVHSLDPNVPVTGMRTLDDQIDRNLAIERLVARLAAAFGLAAAILVAAGIYGLMALIVTRRTVEIGVRMALGARDRSVVWIVLREVLTLVGTGAALAVPVSWGFARYVQSQLYGVAPGDPIVAGGLLLSLTLIAAIAAVVPARRALQLDAIAALRHE